MAARRKMTTHLLRRCPRESASGGPTEGMTATGVRSDARDWQLRWRCRRGLLENDLILDALSWTRVRQR